MQFGYRINLGEMYVPNSTSERDERERERDTNFNSTLQTTRTRMMKMMTLYAALGIATELIYSIRKTIEWPFHIKLYLANT